MVNWISISQFSGEFIQCFIYSFIVYLKFNILFGFFRQLLLWYVLLYSVLPTKTRAKTKQKCHIPKYIHWWWNTPCQLRKLSFYDMWYNKYKKWFMYNTLTCVHFTGIWCSFVAVLIRISHITLFGCKYTCNIITPFHNNEKTEQPA